MDKKKVRISQIHTNLAKCTLMSSRLYRGAHAYMNPLARGFSDLPGKHVSLPWTSWQWWASIIHTRYMTRCEWKGTKVDSPQEARGVQAHQLLFYILNRPNWINNAKQESAIRSMFNKKPEREISTELCLTTQNVSSPFIINLAKVCYSHLVL